MWPDLGGSRVSRSNLCSNTRMSTVLRPTWWSYPAQCPAGHPWGPGRVIVGWMPCDCPAVAREPGHGHLWVRCRATGCREIWYRPEHAGLRAGVARVRDIGQLGLAGGQEPPLGGVVGAV